MGEHFLMVHLPVGLWVREEEQAPHHEATVGCDFILPWDWLSMGQLPLFIYFANIY